MKRSDKSNILSLIGVAVCVGAVIASAWAEEKPVQSDQGILVKVRPGAQQKRLESPSPDIAVPLVVSTASDSIVASVDSASEAVVEDSILRFEIRSYTLDGATLLTEQDINQTVAPYLGKDKDFSDVQRALEGIEDLYAQKGYSAVHVLLPEQELEQGDVHFHVIESRFGKITVKDNKVVSETNALNAIPSVRMGGIPRSKQIARELKLANENPARQLNVVLQAGEKDEELDATVLVTDSKPGAWSTSIDNTGSPETGRSRLGISYRHANLFDKDHVANVQVQVSPEHMDRVTVIGGSYKIPLYQRGDSAEIFGGYSNVNSVVGGLSNFQGGGIIFSARYNHPLEKLGSFDPRIAYGLDLRDFKAVQQTTPPVTTLYNEIMVMPASLTYSAQGKVKETDVGINASVAANLPWLSKGHAADFANYDQVNLSSPTVNYRVLRFGGNIARSLYGDWQLRAAANGQWSRDILIQGEQLRLGGMDGVRGFTEGSEGGETGLRGNLEGYTPALNRWNLNTRALAFIDAGQANASNGSRARIASYGAGIRTSYANQLMLRMDIGRILKAGNDPQQQVGDWRVHLGLSATF